MPRVPARSASAIRQLGLLSPQCVLLARCLQPLPRELADRLEHPEALLAVRIGAAADEALVEQRRQRVEVGVADRFGGLERGAAAEHREPGEELLLVLVEQVVAPRDRGAQRCMALVGVAAALEEVEPLPDPLEQLLGAEQLDPRGGELDRERETVEAADQLVHGRRVTDVGADCLRALEEQRDGVGLDHGRQVELDLAGYPQRLAARRDDPEGGRGREQLGDRPGRIGQQLLEVVENDVRLLVAEPGRDRGGVSPEAPRRAAIRGTTSAASRTGASGTKTVPPSASSARNRASSIENRVLPVPPGPTIVSTRGSRSSHSAAASKSSRSRPRKCVAGVGRSTAPGVRSGGNSARAELEQLRRGIEVLQPVAPEVA